MYTNPLYKSIRISENTDINSFHQKAIISHIKKVNPKSILDLGCGTGFLLRKINKIYPHIELTGVDLLNNKSDKYIKYIKTSIKNFFKFNKSLNYDLIICCHTLEHCEKPSNLVGYIKKNANKSFIIICPMEKEFKWGLNYHINFFENKKSFLSRLNLEKERAKIIVSLGDIFYAKVN